MEQVKKNLEANPQRRREQPLGGTGEGFTMRSENTSRVETTGCKPLVSGEKKRLSLEFTKKCHESSGTDIKESVYDPETWCSWCHGLGELIIIGDGTHDGSRTIN